MDTNSILDAIKTRYGLPSDYALAHELGVTRSMISAYRKHKRMLGEEPAIRAAALLGLNPGYVLASIEAERTQSESARAEWLSVADRLKKPARAGFANTSRARSVATSSPLLP